MAKPIATECIEDVVKRINTIPTLRDKVFHVYSDQELLDKTKGLMYSCVAVIYAGLHAVTEAGSTHKVGLSAEIVVDTILFFRSNAQAQSDPKTGAVAILDAMRNSFKDTRSPSGHFWRFQSETAIELKSGLVGYLQRWAAPVQLT